MGKFRLNTSQIADLGRQDQPYDWTNDVESAYARTEGAMNQSGFSALELRGAYFYASTDDNDNQEEHIGQYRVRYHWNECGTATIMAQQITDDDDQYTFRKWNPDKKNVPYGESTDADGDAACGNVCCCYICMCINCMMNVAFEEVVDKAVDGKL